MKSFLFTKMSGAGNDFILFDRKINPEIELSPQIIQKLCERHSGIGADGILEISDSDELSFVMNYFNADGTTGSLCGNGARCAILYGHKSGRFKNNFAEFTVNKKKYSGEVLGENKVKFYLNSPKNLKYNFKIKAANQLINASYADTGAPHVVINIKDVLKDPKNPNSFFKDIDKFPVLELAKEIRFHKDFLPEGTNVNFTEIRDEEIKIRTYERGVENETLACGTGSVAAALVARVNNKLVPPITLLTKSNEKLLVDFELKGQDYGNLSLTGPAEITFKGEIII